MNSSSSPYVLSLAGFDPSGGAGVVADCKTMERHKVMGLSAITCITYQNENEFDGVEFLGLEAIERQLIPLFRLYKIEWAKIGMIKDLAELKKLVNLLKAMNPNINLIWDTVLKTSAGYSFIHDVDETVLKEVLQQLYLITPNTNEIKILAKHEDAMQAATHVSQHCAVLLKGGHSAEKDASDYLFIKNALQNSFSSERLIGFEKHGSGCVLSAAIVSHLANGKTLEESCEAAKKYMDGFFASNKTKLGQHVKSVSP